MQRLTVAVSGATGYAGGEIIRLLSGDPVLDVTTVTGSSTVGSALGEHQPHLTRYRDLVIAASTPEELAGHDVVVLALPHGASGAVAAELEAAGEKAIIVDLAADHRLVSASAWEDFYGSAHQGTWTYGLPELLLGDGTKQREELRSATRIAVPGCNVTAVTLGFQPLLAAGLIDPARLHAVLANGVSGAGKALKPHMLSGQIIGDATPYGVGGVHRHVPEIEQNLNTVLGESVEGGPVRISFTPTLVPMTRGILATLHAPLTDPGADTADRIAAAFATAYADEPFVDVLPAGMWPHTKNVSGSNMARIQYAVDERAGTVAVSVALDNLVRGTAGQALQSIHLALGLDETAGLPTEGVAP